MAKPNRRLTKEQFAENTTIDGSRIEFMQDEMVDRFNNLENIDIKRRFTQTNYVFGYLPPINWREDPAMTQSYISSCAPWMKARNDNYYETNATPEGWQLTTSLTTPSLGEETNKYRIKGNRRVNTNNDNHFFPNQTHNSYILSNTFYFGKPVIIDAVAFTMITDAILYQNDWAYGVNGPARTFNDMYIDCVMIDIAVDNPYVPENKSLTNLVYKKNNYQVDADFYQYDLIAANPPISDMEPPILASDPRKSVPTGYWAQEQNLNINIPEKSRVTININIPFHDNLDFSSGFFNGESTLDNYKWNEWEGQAYSGCLTVLEEIE